MHIYSRAIINTVQNCCAVIEVIIAMWAHVYKYMVTEVMVSGRRREDYQITFFPV